MGLEINGLDTLQTKLDYIAINHAKDIKGKSLLIIASYFSNTTESLKNYKMMQELKVAFGQVVDVKLKPMLPYLIVNIVAFYLLPIIIKYTGSAMAVLLVFILHLLET